MAARVTTHERDFVPSMEDYEQRFRGAGLEPRSWSNAPNDRFDWHEHDRHKIVFCVSGAITFHTNEGDFLLEPGDRLDLGPGTPHAAHIHPPDGVTCVEAFADGPEDLPGTG